MFGQKIAGANQNTNNENTEQIIYTMKRGGAGAKKTARKKIN